MRLHAFYVVAVVVLFAITLYCVAAPARVADVPWFTWLISAALTAYLDKETGHVVVLKQA